MKNKVTADDIGRVYTHLSMTVPLATAGEDPVAVVAALLLIAVLVEKQRPWENQQISRREAFLDLVGKMYDRTDIDPAKRVQDEGASDASL